MGFFSKKRTVSSPLVCLFCPQVDPLWFSKENADRIPFCTSCHLQLVPDSFKQVLVSGECPNSLQLDNATALAGTMSAMTILWASLNSTQDLILAKSPVSWDVWDPETLDEWPVISQARFLGTFGDCASLASDLLGNLANQRPFLALMPANFMWRVEESPNKTIVRLWPKESLSLVNGDNFDAIKSYLELARPLISGLEIWQLIDQLIALSEDSKFLLSSRKLFGFDVVLHSFTGLTLHDADGFRSHEDFSSKEQLALKPGGEIDPFGKDVAKRLYPKSEARFDFELLGPFALKVKVVDSGTYKHFGVLHEDRLKLIHSFTFKVLASGDNENHAKERVWEKIFEKYGFVVRREGQNWIIDKMRGVDYFEHCSDDVHESRLFSKIVEVRTSSPEAWRSTAWRFRSS
jgi:hypothetical protein